MSPVRIYDEEALEAVCQDGRTVDGEHRQFWQAVDSVSTPLYDRGHTAGRDLLINGRSLLKLRRYYVFGGGAYSV